VLGYGIEQDDGIAVFVAPEHFRRGDRTHLMTMASLAIYRHSHRLFLSRPATPRFTLRLRRTLVGSEQLADRDGLPTRRR
jgi:hypothetical protein